MLTRWYDIDRDAAALDALHRRMVGILGDQFSDRWFRLGTREGQPLANLYDGGSTLMAVVQAPGISDEDLTVEVHGDVLTVSGERTIEPPEGYRVHRSERASTKFSRSFGLPCKVDAERTKAELNAGLLVVTMDKHPEAKPRQISVTKG